MAKLEDKLTTLRGRIDKVDRKIVNLILQRFQLVEKVSLEKRKKKISIVNHKREAQILTNVSRIAKDKGYDEDLFREIFQAIIHCTTKFERKLIDSGRE